MKPGLAVSNTPNPLLDQLDDLKSRFASPQSHALETILSRLIRQSFKEADALIRFHELLLFVRAHPQSARVMHLAESLLKSFGKRVEALRET